MAMACNLVHVSNLSISLNAKLSRSAVLSCAGRSSKPWCYLEFSHQHNVSATYIHELLTSRDISPSNLCGRGVYTCNINGSLRTNLANITTIEVPTRKPWDNSKITYLQKIPHHSHLSSNISLKSTLDNV